MRALILAAGRGKRLRPLTDHTPKPLVRARGKYLCQWHLTALKRAGITQIVMNTAHLAQQFETLPEELESQGLHLQLSREGDSEHDALESLGGIVNALSLLDPLDRDEPFLVLAGDVVHHFDLTRLVDKASEISCKSIDAHLIAVPNPDYHLKGDMTVLDDGRVIPGAGPHTFACMMVVAPRIFKELPPKPAKLFPWLWKLAEKKRMTAEVYQGFWGNIGTLEEYDRLLADDMAYQCFKD